LCHTAIILARWLPLQIYWLSPAARAEKCFTLKFIKLKLRARLKTLLGLERAMNSAALGAEVVEISLAITSDPQPYQ